MDQNYSRQSVVTAYVAGIVTVLAVAAGALGIAVAANGNEDDPSRLLYAASSVDEISQHFGVRATYFAVSPCGDTDHVLGCWSADTPDIVWISAEVKDPDLRRWVLLHEIGHVLHHRLGVASTECAADMFARSMLGEPPTEVDLHC